MTLVAELIHAVGELPVVEVDVNVIRSWIQFVAEVTAVVIIILTVRKRSDRKLEKLITEQTQPIQPGYRNGGESLADVANLARSLKGSVDTLERVHREQGDTMREVRERVLDLSDKVDRNRESAEEQLATLTTVVERNAEAAATLGLALTGQTPPPTPADGSPDLD